MSEFGNLIDEGREFVINRPDLPQPWHNLLTNKQYQLEIDQTGRADQIWGVSAKESVYRYFYLRDVDSNEVWSLTGHLANNKFDQYQCRYRFNQVVWQVSNAGIETKLSVFVPSSFDGEIWQLELKNLVAAKRRLALFTVVGLPDSITEAGLEHNYLVGRDRFSHVTYYLATDRKLDSFDCLKSAFLGPNQNFGQPKNVELGKCGRTNAVGEPSILAGQHQISLGRDVSTKFNFFIGSTTDLTAVKKQITNWRRIGNIERIKEKNQLFWQELFGQIRVHADDDSFDRLFNYWLKYQAVTIGAYPSLLTLDQLRSRLLEQTKDGGHQTINTTIDLLTNLINFAKETGDLKFFDQNNTYADGGSGSILQHFIRGIQYCQSNLSERSLVTTQGTTTESVMLTGQLAYLLRQAQPILNHFNEHYLIDKTQKLLLTMAGNVNKYFKTNRYYSTRSNKVKDNPIRIDAETQSWLIIGGLIEPKSAFTALRVVDQKLGTPFGVVNFIPPYKFLVTENFEFSVDSPGVFINSSVRIEVIANLIWAQTLLGQAETAFKLWQQINPINRAQKPTVFNHEPYLTPDFVFGPAHPRFGQGIGGWKSHGPGRLWLVLLEQILGIQPVLGGLKIDPCIPKDWQRLEIHRQFRGADYHIRINNPFRVNKGIDRLIVDGTRLTGNVIRPFAGGSHLVEVTLG